MPGTFTKLLLKLRGARFAIMRADGLTRLAFGSAPPAFVGACADLLERADINRAWVAQVGTSGDARLAFSANVPDWVRQRIRNVWTPPPGPGPSGAAMSR